MVQMSAMRVATTFTGILIACGGICACQTPAPGALEQLREGMNESEVVSIMGDPSSRYPAQLNKSGSIDIPARWQYGDNLSSIATSSMFQDQPPPSRVWVIYFDASARVSGWQKPEWAR
ncbi:MAG: hypothetical protein EXS15_07240 [Phycisphaerales bacterium]|nr:hypothetical protein [Phycisphaerales bacterium]